MRIWFRMAHGSSAGSANKSPTGFRRAAASVSGSIWSSATVTVVAEQMRRINDTKWTPPLTPYPPGGVAVCQGGEVPEKFSVTTFHAGK